MNRAFPGDSTSGPTAMIADFIERRLLPGMTYAVDLHSGGTQSVFAPCGYVYGMGERAFRDQEACSGTRLRGAENRGRDHDVVRRVAVRGVRTARCGDGCRRARWRRGARSRRDRHRLGRHAQSAAPCGRADRRAESDAHGAAAYAKPGVLRHGDHRRPVRAFGRRRRRRRSRRSGRQDLADRRPCPASVDTSVRRRRHRTCPADDAHGHSRRLCLPRGRADERRPVPRREPSGRNCRGRERADHRNARRQQVVRQVSCSEGHRPVGPQG